MNPFNSLCLAEFEKYNKKKLPLFFFSYEWLLRNNQFISSIGVNEVYKTPYQLDYIKYERVVKNTANSIVYI